ncbi:putative WD40/YVTN repeat-like-containing domain, WD40 repeat protein [Trachipleistophora hominis]|uniref:Putative WD40/YVTN repeat-like-containing domain, WD40 repeat protein n=1 Tax=Trachipleistophora hominis TaxID=72359 RepID=L7JUA8_TRAHO|nr:putative WD40/YVTN repeat-like-containing domain, WD40 repeat protein [Trachipleistophora hominis]
MAFILTNIIPTLSTSKGIVQHRNTLYFSSSNSIYILNKHSCSFVVSLHGEIKDLQSNGIFIFAQTSERLYMLNGSKILATMKMNGVFTVTDTHLIVGECELFLYELPVKYSMIMFKRVGDIRAHNESVLRVKMLENGIVLSVGRDSTVRMSSFRDGRSRVLCYHRELPVDVFFYEDLFENIDDENDRVNETENCEKNQNENDKDEKNIYKTSKYDENDKNAHAISFVNNAAAERGKAGNSQDILDTLSKDYFIVTVSERGTINTFSTKKRKIVKRTFLDRNVRHACRKGDQLFLLTDENVVLVIKDDDIRECSVDINAYEMQVLDDMIVLRGASNIAVYEYLRPVAGIGQFIKNEKIQKVNSLTPNLLQNNESEQKESLCCLYSVPLCKIVDFSENNDIMLSCADNTVHRANLINNTCYFGDSTTDIFNVDEPVYQIFYKCNVLVCITETCLVKAYDVRKGTLFREINLGFKVSCADSNEDNSVLFVCNYDSYEINIVDIKRSKVVDTLKLSAMIRKLCYFNNSVYFLSMDNQLVRYFFMNGQMENFEMKKTIYDFEISNNNVVVSLEKEIVVTDGSFNILRSFNLKFVSRNRNEMFISSKPCTSCSLTYDGTTLVCGAQANEIKIVDLETGCVIQTLKLSRNKEKENYKKRLGVEKKDEFKHVDVIEAMKIKYMPNGFLVLTRESVFLFKVKSVEVERGAFLRKMDENEIKESLKEHRFVRALLGSINLKSKIMIKECIRETRADVVDDIVKNVRKEDVTYLKGVINEVILAGNTTYQGMVWLKALVYNFTGHLVESDLEVIKMLKAALK